jgi:hypothetical protein
MSNMSHCKLKRIEDMVTMVKKAKTAPSGFYTAPEAAKRLNVKLTTFYAQVRAGKYRRYDSQGREITGPLEGKRQEGFYLRKPIDEVAQARELFTLLYSVDPITFEQANSEDDIRGIVDLCIAIYGQGGTPSVKARLEIWHKNPNVYYVVKQEDIVVGYVSLIWFEEMALQHLMGPEQKKEESAQNDAGRGIYSVTGFQNAKLFTEGQPINHLFISLGVRPGMTNEQQRKYGLRLLTGIVETLEDFARREMPVRKLYATSATQDGIQLAKKIGMVPIKYPNDPLIRFEIDLELSDSPMAHNYREIMRSNYRAYVSQQKGVE